MSAAVRDRPVVVVIDEVVTHHHADRVARWSADLDVIARVELRAGERCKTPQQLDALLAAFEACALPKHGAVVAIGGGTVTDVAGLAALLMRRSVPLVLLPTTLLAQVDAAVGGKNGINSPTSKNMIGHFHHPLVVASDPELLETLGRREVVGGIAECIKVFAVADLDALERHRATLLRPEPTDPDGWTSLVVDAQDVKLRLLADDPFEASSMRLLNYGHAFAHLLEERSGFALPHGEAVLLGMLIENEVSVALGLAAPAVEDLQQMITDLVSPDATRHWIAFEAVERELDKVRQMRRSTMNLVCVTELGDAVIVDDAPDEVLARAWRNADDRLRSATSLARALT